MKRDEDDEIQVLGTSKSKPKYARWIIAFIVLLFIGLLAYFSIPDEKAHEGGKADIFPVIQQDSMGINMRPSVKLHTDSINDVILNIYALRNLSAGLSLQMPSPTDTTTYFVLRAADIRKDNKEIVGDFVLKGKQLSKGKRKTGYCALINGKITLGNTISDDIKEYCIAHNGDFFRQYALVMDGEIQENRLKGKAIRRALAQQGNDFYIVESVNRESLYDFSEALADMGFTNALYLVGGSSYAWWRDDSQTIHELGKSDEKPLPNTNYLIFEEAKSH